MNIFDDDNMTDYDFIDYLEMQKRRFLGLKLKDALQTDAERISPDTYGADALFIEVGFMTDEMLTDFPVIAKEFIKNVPISLQREDEIHYTDTTFSSANPYSASTKKIMPKMLYEAKNGDFYTIQLFKHLYQIYHKKEYKSIKRFSHINADEVFSIAEDGNPNISVSSNISRILTMCSLLGIELDVSCSLLFLILNNDYENAREESDEKKELEIGDDDFKTALNEVVELAGTEDEAELFIKAKIYKDQMKFAGKALQYYGYRYDYAEFSNTEYITFIRELALTRMLLKKLHPKRSYSFEELQYYAANFNSISALCCASDDAESFLDIILGYTDDCDLHDPIFEDSLFQPDQFHPVIQSPKKESRTVESPKTPVKKDYNQENLLNEIEELRRKLHDKEYSLNNMTHLYVETKNRLKSNESYKDKYEEAYTELIALREHVYEESLEHRDVSYEENTDDLKTILREKKIAIIGGPDNWISKVKKEFPEWIYLNFQSSTTIPDHILDNCDYVYFYSGFLKHNVYYRFINIVRERSLPFGYINISNINAMINQINEDLERKQNAGN